MLNPSFPQHPLLDPRDVHNRSEQVKEAERAFPILYPDTILKAAVITGLVLLLSLLASRPAR
jgi:hypothetical protein